MVTSELLEIHLRLPQTMRLYDANLLSKVYVLYWGWLLHTQFVVLDVGKDGVGVECL